MVLDGFKESGLPNWLIGSCQSVGFKSLSAVQKACIPPTLAGKDVLGCAKTGSGKTAAFVLPILAQLSKDPYGVYAVVLSPTRELASQIKDQFCLFGKSINVRVTLVVGGFGKGNQMKKLSGKPHIIVATPGRLTDILENESYGVKIDKIKFLVFDEADRLFNEFESNQLGTIIKNAPTDRQTLLYSATMSSVLEKVLKLAKNEPFIWKEELKRESTVQQLSQSFILIANTVKDTYLVHLVKRQLEKDDLSQIIVFTRTKLACETISMLLGRLGLANVSLNSAMTQKLRLISMAKFKSNASRLLVATDVASRGLDIPGVALVINYDFPSFPVNYIHRVGRTARYGQPGCAISLVRQSDLKHLKAVEEKIERELDEEVIDEEKHILPDLLEVSMSRRKVETIIAHQEASGERRSKEQEKEFKIKSDAAKAFSDLLRKSSNSGVIKKKNKKL